MAWERVYTINDFWDGPRLGVADVNGLPHIYQSQFNDRRDDFDDFFVVSPIDPELFQLILEDWEIWVRWSDAFDRGETTQHTHPALDYDRPRHDELNKLIGNRLKPDLANARTLKAQFRSIQKGWNGMEVRWSEC